MQDLSNLPFGSEYDPPERIVCAANKYGDNFVLAGVRHACPTMRTVIVALDDRHCYPEEEFGEEIQGFLTSKHRFLNRQEAWKLAVEQNQIVRRVGGDTSKGGTLYSENLY